MKPQDLIKELNRALADEWLGIYQYWLCAKVITGPLMDEIIEMLEDYVDDELRHANMLAERILELGGTPLMSPELWFKETTCGYLIPEESDAEKILEQNIKSEACAITFYKNLAKQTLESDTITHDIVMEILDDEIEHKENMQALQEELCEL